MPLGKLTPTIRHSKVQAAALALREQMPDCKLSDQAIELVALRCNTGAPTAQLAKRVGMSAHAAYLTLSRPQAQQLMSELARTLLGQAAIDGVLTMQRIMRGKDASLAYRAADSMMERAGLGVSQRATPDGKVSTVFQFAFGAPQAVASPADVALTKAQMGPVDQGTDAGYPSKTPASRSGEAPAPVILSEGDGQKPGEAFRLQSVGPRNR